MSVRILLSRKHFNYNRLSNRQNSPCVSIFKTVIEKKCPFVSTFFSNTSKLPIRWIFALLILTSFLVVIPIIVEETPNGAFGEPFYICVSTVLPSVTLLVFNVLLYRKIKKLQDGCNEDDFANKETLCDVKLRAKIILAISVCWVASLVLVSLRYVSILIITPGFETHF